MGPLVQQSIMSTSSENKCNIVAMEHVGVVRKKIKKFRKSNFLTDVEIICQNGSVYLHKLVLFQMMPEITSYLCNDCDGHADTVLIVPEGTKDEIEREVKNLYSFGIVSGLRELLGILGNKKDVPLKQESNKESRPDESIENEEMIGSPVENEDAEELPINAGDESVYVAEPMLDSHFIADLKSEIESEGDDPQIVPTPDTVSGDVFLPASYKDAKNGGRILICPAGYKFSKSREQDKKTYYKCRNQKTDNCRVMTTVSKEDNMIIRMTGIHTHDTEVTKNAVNEFVEAAVDEAVKNPTLSPRQVADNISVELESLNLPDKPFIKTVSIIRRITRGRQKLLELSGLAVPKSWGRPEDSIPMS